MRSNNAERIEEQERSSSMAIPPPAGARISPKTQVGRGARVLRISMLGVAVLAAVVFIGRGIQFLADQPRERAQRNFNYVERVWHGLNMVGTMALLRFQAAPEPFPRSSLPAFELTLSSKAQRALNADLPDSGLLSQDAMVTVPAVTIAGSTTSAVSVPAKVQYNGISINHWGMPWKSWRFDLIGASYKGMPSLILTMPRSDTQLENWLGNEMARRLGGGLLTPDSEFVTLRLNGRLNGVRLLQEPANQDFLRRRDLPKGKLFFGDITTAQIYDGVRRERLFSEQAGWEVRSPFPEDQGSNEILRVINLVRRVHNPYDFYYQLPTMMEVGELLRYMALLEIVSSVHIDETHNWRMYLNPETQRFSPIVFNTVAYYWENSKSIDLAPNDLFRVVLSNPGLREEKDRIMWQALQGPLSEQVLLSLIDGELARIRPDYYASFLKWGAGDRGINLLSNEEWDRAVEELKSIIPARHAYIRSLLTPTDARYRLSAPDEAGAQQLAIYVGSRSGVRMESVTLRLNRPEAGLPVRVTRRGIEDLKREVRLDRRFVQARSQAGGLVTISLSDSLQSKRRIQPRREPVVVPSTYVYEITLPRGVQAIEVVGSSLTNAVTGEKAELTKDESVEIPGTHRPNSVWWDPSEFVDGTR